MTQIYLIRHAEAEGNLYRIAQGQYDSILTDRGLRQVEALAERFRPIPVDAAYSSDLHRTCATARAVCVPKGLPLHRCKKLREIQLGDWEQKTWGEIARESPEQLEYFTHRLDLWRVPGAETIDELLRRITEAVREIAAANEGKTVAVFSHGCAIRVLLASLQGYSVAQLGQTPHGDNTAVSLLEAEGDTVRVVFRDDSSHLAALTAGDRPGAPRKTALEPGLYFLPARLPEEEGFLSACVKSGWPDSRPYDEGVLLQDAAARPTLVARLGEQAVGAVQFHPEKEAERGRGWISLYCLAPEFRSRGWGVQLLGQAVRFYRPRNRHTLCLSLSDGSGAAGFFQTYGFAPGESAGVGSTVWTKDIAYRD